ncbi:serine/threonine protein kinase [Yimella sp. cx-51]|nr:serine/threonine protein kinase [Yimella sp. cx-51]
MPYAHHHFSNDGESPVPNRTPSQRSALHCPTPAPLPLTDLDFVPPPELGAGQRWSTWSSIERLQRGPAPRPSWVVTHDESIDTELGVLKTGKEADVFLVERRSADGRTSAVMAAKRYRDAENRSFRRHAGYTEGRRIKDTREARAVATKTRFGKQVAAGVWAQAEWGALVDLWSSGVPVPYPVQIDEREILMELVVDEAGDPAPRLAATRPTSDQLAAWFEQLRSALIVLSGKGIVHGDLSAYNILAGRDGVVLIDLPQTLDLIANPNGTDFLHRDCVNVCTWFASKGFDCDGDELFAELLAFAL